MQNDIGPFCYNTEGQAVGCPHERNQQFCTSVCTWDTWSSHTGITVFLWRAPRNILIRESQHMDTRVLVQVYCLSFPEIESEPRTAFWHGEKGTAAYRPELPYWTWIAFRPCNRSIIGVFLKRSSRLFKVGICHLGALSWACLIFPGLGWITNFRLIWIFLSGSRLKKEEIPEICHGKGELFQEYWLSLATRAQAGKRHMIISAQYSIS